MKNYQKILFLFLLFSAGSLSGQQLTPYVISPSGGFYNNSTGMLSFTTGEMAAVETYKSPSVILTQGFQQTWDLGTYTTKYPDQQFSFEIYPNPSNGDFNLITTSETNKQIDVRIFDVLGKEILKKEFYHQDKITIQSFNLSHCVQGIYLVTLTTSESDSGPAYHFVNKIQIVK